MSANPLSCSTDNGMVYSIALDERFDYSSVDPFTRLKHRKHDCPVEVVVDMSATRFIDSSGIALLFCLLHWIKSPALKITVTNAAPDIKVLLGKARHGDKLTII